MLRTSTFMYLKGVSGFIAFTVLLVISSALALYIYTYSSNLYLVYKPKHSYVYGYALCYNVSALKLVIEDGIEICGNIYRTPGDVKLSSTKYLCIFRVGKSINLTIVYENFVEVLYINRSCLYLSNSIPLTVHGYNGNSEVVVLEVKTYDPWTK
ncbi:MAG: hypothetical protein QXL96_08725 [Ignisphaera sp.]